MADAVAAIARASRRGGASSPCNFFLGAVDSGAPIWHHCGNTAGIAASQPAGAQSARGEASRSRIAELTRDGVQAETGTR